MGSFVPCPLGMCKRTPRQLCCVIVNATVNKLNLQCTLLVNGVLDLLCVIGVFFAFLLFNFLEFSFQMNANQIEPHSDFTTKSIFLFLLFFFTKSIFFLFFFSSYQFKRKMKKKMRQK